MDHKLCKDCRGFCCDDIGLYYAPHELQTSYHRFLSWRKREKEDRPATMSIAENSEVPMWEGIWLTYPMLIFSHQDYIHPDGDVDFENEGRKVYHYSCKHHNKKTGDCDIYEERPMLCRTFPNDGLCKYRKVKDKRVKAFLPKWFKVGMTYSDYYYSMNPDEKPKEAKPNDECPTEVKAEETK